MTDWTDDYRSLHQHRPRYDSFEYRKRELRNSVISGAGKAALVVLYLAREMFPALAAIVLAKWVGLL